MSSSLYTVQVDRQLHPGVSQEWLLTNGIGGFASGTVVGCNTRRYHGLLCAATQPPVGRIMTLSRVNEVLTIDRADVTHELGVNQFAANFQPEGFRYLSRFHLDHIAQWDYDVDGVKITKQLHLLHKRNVVALRYTVDPGAHSHVALVLVPFVAMRDYHGVRRGTDAQFRVAGDSQHLSVAESHHTLHLRCDRSGFVQHHDWWRGHHYALEAERGLDHIEDLFSPGKFALDITQPTTLTLWASLEPLEKLDWDDELKSREIAATPRVARPGVQQKLHRAANDFVVDRKCPDGSMGTTVIAGYPWFADWGRDTMISLPGLLLATGRFKQAAQVLSLFAEYVSEGMVPNRFDDYTNQPSYNTVDASLWFVHACSEYFKATSDAATWEKVLLPACRAIVQGYMHGTRYQIKMDADDGLLMQGDLTTQLTWMDAKCNGVVFTPRQGKAVEINALWYNALRIVNENDLADRTQRSFVEAFWISPFRGLCDVVNGKQRDTKLRPNQIFAVSLPHSALNEDQQHAVVETVRRELLTPYGLRTLAANDPGFRATFRGSPFERDGAYHNGTIWPWLIGAFLEAYLRVNKRSPESIAQAKAWLRPLLDAMDTHGCIGQIAEVYEAAPPHRPGGCPAQAWSVAEVLRIATALEM